MPVFRPFVHRPGPDLDLDPFSVGADNRRVERLVVVGLGHGDIILEPPGDRFPEAMDDAQRLIAVLFLVRIEDDPEGRQVVDLIEIDVLLLHLFVDAVEMLGPALHLRLRSVFPISLRMIPLTSSVYSSLFSFFSHPFGEVCYRHRSRGTGRKGLPTPSSSS